MASESELIAVLTDVFQNGASAWPSENLLIGIGDDGAILAARNRKSVVVADMAVEDVHFRRQWSSLAEIGGKVTAANLADIYAMGGVPTYLLVTAGLPQDFTKIQMRELASGIQAEANLVGALVVGGDLTRSEKIVISITAFGDVDQPILRSGAQVGDQVVISGFPGWASAGLAIYQKNMGQFAIRNDAIALAMAAHRKPPVNYTLVTEMVKQGVNAMCDVSDGLLSEAGHLAASSGVGIEINADILIADPQFPLINEMGSLLDIDPWEWILTGGEDHCFLATMPSGRAAPEGVFPIGRVIEGSGVHLTGDESGERLERYQKTGYRHFDQ